MNQIELYSEADIRDAGTVKGKRMAAFFALCGLTLALFILAVALRYKPLGLTVTSALCCAAYFLYSAKVAPHVKYCRFLREMANGMTRDTEGFFGAIAETSRMVDGVEVYDFILRVDEGETDERLFLWDADKKKPEISEGRRVRVTSHSNFVKVLDLL